MQLELIPRTPLELMLAEEVRQRRLARIKFWLQRRLYAETKVRS